MSQAVTGKSLGRALGGVAAAAGALVLTSYALRFFPVVFLAERWSRTRPRRALRLALKYAWGLALGAALVAGAASLLVDR